MNSVYDFRVMRVLRRQPGLTLHEVARRSGLTCPTIYVLSGRVDLCVEDKAYHLGPDETILFDGLLDHSYVQQEAGEYLTVHVPKDIRAIERLLDAQGEPARTD